MRPLILLLLLAVTSQANAQAIIAHRGASYDAPENTAAAFQLAWQQGADGIEADFFLTADGKIVCTHDKTTERVAPNQPPLAIAASGFDELRRLDVGTWKSPQFAGERMPLLSDVLATVPDDGRIFIEIKTGPEIVETLLADIDRSGLRADQMTILSFDAAVIATVRAARPDLRGNWLTSWKTENGPVRPSRAKVLKTLHECDATGLGCRADRAVVDGVFAAAVKDAGYELHVWTVNDPADARHWASVGVDSITTDRPKLVGDAIGVVKPAGRR